MAELVRGVGDGGVNDGERRVVRKLLDELPAGWKLLPNIEIRGNKGRMLEVDCIVASPHAVYLIEIKDWRGEIEGDDNRWFHNGIRRASPNKQINDKAKVLKDLLREADRQLGSLSVESFVVLARSPDRLDLAPGTRRHTRLLGEIVPALQDISLLPGRPRSMPDLPDRVARALAPLACERRGPRQIGAWRILETLSQNDDCTVYRATSTLAADGPAAHMSVWNQSGYRMTDAERADERAAILRDFVAARRMGPHRLIVGAIDAFEDGDDVVVVTDEPVGVPLAQRLASGQMIEPDARLIWIDDLAEAVAHAHAHGVVHRHITPETVLIVSGGVRLAGFGRARIEAEGTIRHDPESVEGRDARYLAPEAVNRELGPATEKADLFGLAAVAWTIWSGKPLPATWQTSDVPLPRPEAMPDGLWQAIAPLLDVVPARRTVTLDEFRRAVTAAMIGPTAEPPVAPAEYPVGSLIADRYEVVDKLGAGGFAVVYRAVDRHLGVERAVKVLDARAGKEAGVREMRALESVAHPHVVRVRSIDTTPTVPAQWYITSDIAAGEPLSSLGRLPVDEAVEIADQLLDACIAIHPQEDGTAADGGIVHRDIKPSNVLYDAPSRHATLIDFNIASASGSTVVTMAGTPAHQPPGPDPDRWSPDPDLFGVGVLLFETLTGEHPYADGRHPSSGVRSLVSLLPDAPEPLSTFLDKATSPSRSDRFGSAVAMRSALREAMECPPPSIRDTSIDEIAAAPVVSSVMEAPTAPMELPARVEPPQTVRVPATALVDGAPSQGAQEPGRRRSRLALVGLAALVIVAVAIGGLLAMRGADEPADSATTSETSGRSEDTTATTAATGTSADPAATAPTEAEPSDQQCPPGFPVKGNVNDAGELIFHDVGWRYYDSTWPERCFVDPAAAVAAGFRASEVQ